MIDEVRQYHLFRGLLLAVAVLALIVILPGGYPAAQVQAQTIYEDVWSDPENLSRSGSTTDPQIIIDDQGTIHVAWRDGFAGLRFTKMGEEGWTKPTTAGSIFGPNAVVFISGPAGQINAFWINKESETLDLYHRSTSATSFPEGWSNANRLAQWVQDFDVVLGEDEQLHLAYVRSAETAEAPAGIYYRRLNGTSRSWTSSVLLYESAYLRSLTAENASVEIETQKSEEEQYVYVVWDNRLRGDSFFARSANGGQDWDEPVMIQASDSEKEKGKQYGLKVAASTNDLMLLWQEEASATSCRQFSMVSKDHGDTWKTKQRMFPGFTGCPFDNQVAAYNNRIILYTTLLNRPNFLAWDGSQWSDPRPQPELANLFDPETEDPIKFQCLQFLPHQRELLLAGCDTGTGGDIWLTRMSLAEIDKWFTPEKYWSYPATVAANISNVDDIALVGASPDGYHAVWSQYSQNDKSAISAVHYAYLDGDRWVESLNVLDALPGRARNLITRIDDRGRLLLFWIGGMSGEVYFSWADSGSARNEAEWAESVSLPVPAPGVNSLDVYIDDKSTFFVSYSIPFNEHRGVYLIQSNDHGATWSEPVIVFDGVKAAWDQVSEPRLAGTGNGSLHLLWTQSTFPDGAGPIALYYSRSSDGGKSWSTAEQVANARVGWSKIIGIDSRVVHRIWEEKKSTRPTLWFEISRDNGLTWESLSSISNLGMSSGIADLVKGSDGSLHLLELVQESTGNLSIQEWTWKGETWKPGNSLNLGTGNINASLIAAGVTPGGMLSSLVYRMQREGETTGSGALMVSGYELEQEGQTLSD